MIAVEAGVSGSRRVVIGDAGHLMRLEKPAEFSHQGMNRVAAEVDEAILLRGFWVGSACALR